MPTRTEVTAPQLRAVIDALPDAVGVHRGGRIVFVNPAAVALLGWSSARDLLGSPILDVVHPDDRAEVAGRVSRMVSTGHPVPVREERFLRRDGSVVVALVRAMPVEWEREPAVMVLCQDVTLLRRTEERLAMADRLASIGTLAAGMAHDLNNPLASLVLTLDLARESAGAAGGLGPEAAQRVRERIDAALAVSERLRAIVADLRVFARQPDEAERLVDVRDPLREALDLARESLRQRCRVDGHLSTAPLVSANEARLVQVFVNLLTNALQALPDKRPPDENEIRVTVEAATRREIDGARVTVADNGVGIAPEHVHRVFELYFTTKPLGMGTGLGLWMVLGVVQRLGGEVSLRSTLGSGTEVEVWLPSARGAAPAEREPSPPRAAERITWVLVVDDDVEIALLLAEILREEHHVEVCHDGRGGLVRARTGAYDVMICDLTMPDLGGRELYEALLEDGQGLEQRLVLSTGGAFTPSAATFLDQVPVPVLHKPFRVARVREVVAQALARLG